MERSKALLSDIIIAFSILLALNAFGREVLAEHGGNALILTLGVLIPFRAALMLVPSGGRE